MAEGPGGRGSGRLDSWKEIAAFFGRDERTVKRWEHRRGLPVRRIPGGGRSPVYAYRNDLEVWLRNSKKPSRSRAIRSVKTSQPTNDLYLNGVYLWQKRTPASLGQAVEIFTQVIAVDPDHAPAHAGLATSYDLMVELDVVTPAHGFPLAKAAAERAILLDPTLSEAQSVLADIEFFWLRQTEQGLKRFELALALDPQSVQALHWHAEALLYAGRFHEALRQIDKAQALDPQSRSILSAKALILFRAGNPAEAERLITQLIANEPDYLPPYWGLIFIHLAREDYAGYLAVSERLFRLKDFAEGLAIVAAGVKGLQTAGPPGMADRMMATAEPHFGQGKVTAYYMAHIHGLRNDWRNAARFLAEALARDEDSVVDYSVDPAFRTVQAVPQFQARIAATALPVIA
ncbi:CDC27 family protein [Taklimakanibacter deserti]|uniref:CDC27 family protein n=1 Tax=Taklimakanibacter deserti TaxID=2267839 RepID=UPI000E65E884